MNSDKDGIRAIVRCGTSKGDIVMEFHRAWSPNGFDRAVSLFERGFYDYTHFYRVVKDFLVQFGITYSDDKELKHEANQPILDDPQLEPKIPFQMGTISYAGSGPNSRTSQLFIAYVAAKSFGTELWETPVGKVIEGMDHVQAFYSYGDMPPWGKGPVQSTIHSGRKYIDQKFPLTDSFQTCLVERIDPQLQRNVVDEKAKNMMHSVDSAYEKAKNQLHKVKLTHDDGSLEFTTMAGIVFLAVLVAWFFVRSFYSKKNKDSAAVSKKH